MQCIPDPTTLQPATSVLQLLLQQMVHGWAGRSVGLAAPMSRRTLLRPLAASVLTED